MKYFLDTNIIIYYLKGTRPSVAKHILTTPSQSIAVPAIVLAEIEFGARKSYNYERTMYPYKIFMRDFSVASFTKAASVIYGQIRSYLEAMGTPISQNDMLIAATVIADDGVLVTANVKEFSRIPWLRIENWTED